MEHFHDGFGVENTDHEYNLSVQERVQSTYLTTIWEALL